MARHAAKKGHLENITMKVLHATMSSSLLISFQTMCSWGLISILCAIGSIFSNQCQAQTDSQKAQLSQAKQAESEMFKLYGEGDYGAASQLGEQILKTRRKILGDDHSDSVNSLNNLTLISTHETEAGDSVV